MPNFRLLESGDQRLLESGGGSLLLEASLPTPRIIRIGTYSFYPDDVTENTTPLMVATLTDEVGPADLDTVLSVVLQVWDKKTGGIMREVEDVWLSGSDCSFLTSPDYSKTELTWLMQQQDTELVVRTKPNESRLAAFNFAWGTASKSGSLTNPFDTTDGDNTVTATIGTHGMAATEDHNRASLDMKLGPGTCFALRVVSSRRPQLPRPQ